MRRNRYGPSLGRRLRTAAASLRPNPRAFGAALVRSARGARQRWREIVAAGTGFALAATAVVGRPALIAWVRDHPYFRVEEIVVTPTSRVRAGDLLQWADLRAGTSIWSIDPDALAARIETHPWVQRACVRRELPHRLVLEVQERRPAAILLIDQLYYLDRAGVIFARLDPGDHLDVPFVTGIEAAVLAGERPFPRHGIRQALKVLELTRSAGLPFRLSEVHIEREQGITVFPTEPRVALVFGWGGYSAKVARLKETLDALTGREGQIREIDLTYDEQAVVRLRQPRGGGQRART